MNQECIFIKNLHNFMMQLRTYKNDTTIDQIKNLVIANSTLLDENVETIDFINNLIDLSEKHISHQDALSFCDVIENYLSYFLLLKPCEVFYIGSNENINCVYSIVPQKIIKKVNLIIVNTLQEALQAKVDTTNCSRPILVTDRIGRHSIEINKSVVLSAINAKSNHMKYNLSDTTIGFLPIMEKRFDSIANNKNTDMVIVGSSYAYQAFPETLTPYSVNLSIWGGDITLAYSIIRKIINSSSIRKFMIVLGYHDIFYESSMGFSGTFPISVEFCDNKSINYDFSIRKGFKANHNKNISLDVFTESIYEENLVFDKIFFKSVTSPFINRKPHDNKESMISYVNTRSYSRDFTYSSKKINSRVISLGKNRDRTKSLAVNIELMEKLLNLISESNSHLYIVIPPFLKYFTENYNSEMKKESIRYINSLSGINYVSIMDYANDTDFLPEDFYDTDHLNLTGAEKICRKISDRGVKL